MKVIACFLFACLSTLSLAPAGAYVGAVDGPAALAERGKELHDRSLTIVQTERARAKQPLCPKAMTTLDTNECYGAELRTTDANYTKAGAEDDKFLELAVNGRADVILTGDQD